MNNPMRILTVPSKSRYELEIEKYGSITAARHAFLDDDSWNRAKASYKRQFKARELLTKRVGFENVADRSELISRLPDYDIIAILGGDNHFTYCADVIAEYQKRTGQDVCATGIFADSKESLGALISYTTQQWMDELETIAKGNFKTERWATIDAVVKNRKGSITALPSFSELYIGESHRIDTSRCIITAPESLRTICEKTAGLLVTTPAGRGEGSWYGNAIKAGRLSLPKPGQRTKNDIRVLALGIRTRPIRITEHETLVINSYNDHTGIIAPDSHHDHAIPFPMGGRVYVRAGTQFPVIVP